jgi:hypothetical protein
MFALAATVLLLMSRTVTAVNPLEMIGVSGLSTVKVPTIPETKRPNRHQRSPAASSGGSFQLAIAPEGTNIATTDRHQINGRPIEHHIAR